MHEFNGMKIIVVKPTVQKVGRRWKERLFSRPWRPWRSWKMVTIPATIPEDKYIVYSNTIYCGEKAYAELNKEVRRQEMSAVPIFRPGVYGLK